MQQGFAVIATFPSHHDPRRHYLHVIAVYPRHFRFFTPFPHLRVIAAKTAEWPLWALPLVEHYPLCGQSLCALERIPFHKA